MNHLHFKTIFKMAVLCLLLMCLATSCISKYVYLSETRAPVTIEIPQTALTDFLEYGLLEVVDENGLCVHGGDLYDGRVLHLYPGTYRVLANMERFFDLESLEDELEDDSEDEEMEFSPLVVGEFKVESGDSAMTVQLTSLEEVKWVALKLPYSLVPNGTHWKALHDEVLLDIDVFSTPIWVAPYGSYPIGYDIDLVYHGDDQDECCTVKFLRMGEGEYFIRLILSHSEIVEHRMVVALRIVCKKNQEGKFEYTLSCLEEKQLEENK